MINPQLNRNLRFTLVLAAAASSACSSTPQQVYHQTTIDAEHAIVVIGVAQGSLLPRGRFGLVLDGHSSPTNKATSTPFLYESATGGPPQSATAKYFIYRVPAGVYTVLLGAIPLPVVKTFGAPGGHAVYIGDFALRGNSGESPPAGALPAAKVAVAALLPVGLPLMKAD